MAEDVLSLRAITRGLGTHLIGKRVVYQPVLASTMEAARLEAQRGACEGTVVVCSRQTAGKGRMKRPWLSPEGNIALSVILRPALSCLPCLVMLASLAVVHSIKEVTGLEPEIKWPNDVLIGGKKVSGILIESALRGKDVDYAILGIGVNVNFKVSEFPEIAARATSLVSESGEAVSRLSLIRRLLVEVERLYLSSSQGCIFEEWQKRLVTTGRMIQVKSGGNTYHGIARSVEADGSLILQEPGGHLKRIVAGDATLT